MEITGEQRIPAPPTQVWNALNDADVLRRCIPGCESLSRLSDTEFEGTITAKIGPVKATFGGRVTLSDVDPPNGYTLSGEGKGAAGFAKGGAQIRLAEAEGATMLRYSAKAQVGGKLAQVGARLIDSTTRKLAEQFFANFTAVVSAPPPIPVPAEAASPAAPAESPAPPPSEGLSPWVWAIGLIAAIALLLWLVIG